MPKAKPSKNSSAKKSNIFVRAINKFNNLHASAKVLTLALIIGVVGGGSYAVFMSSAAGWTYLGTATNSNGTVEFKKYACKSVPVVRKGYMVKSRIVVTKALSNQPQEKYYVSIVMPDSISNVINSPEITTPVKIGQTSETKYIGYASSTQGPGFNAYRKYNAPAYDKKAVLGNNIAIAVSQLSTCP